MSQMVHQRSVLAVQDLDASTRYYTEVLGFSLESIEAPGWSFLIRDSIRLMLGECPDERPASETGNHSWFLHVMVEDVDALHGEIVARGANVVVPLGNRSHGHREFVIETPDGHTILFGEPLAWIAEGDASGGYFTVTGIVVAGDSDWMLSLVLVECTMVEVTIG